MILLTDSHCLVESQNFSLTCNFFPIMKFLVSFAVSEINNCSFGNLPAAVHSMTKSSLSTLLTICIQLKICLWNLHTAIFRDSFAQIWVWESAEYFHVVVWHGIRHFCCLVGLDCLYFLLVSNYLTKPLISDLKTWFCSKFWSLVEQILSTSRHGLELSDLLVKFYSIDSNLGYLRNLLTEMSVLTSSSQAMIFTTSSCFRFDTQTFQQ